MKALIFFPFFYLIFLFSCNPDNSLQTKRVILIGIDGLSVSGFERAKTPNINELIRNGSVSLHTRAVIPTISGPNWASHLLGAGPEQHGVTLNGWTTTYRTVLPVVQDNEGYFFSVFDLIKAQKPELKTAAFYDWKALGYLYNHKSLDKDEYLPDYKNVFSKAIDWLVQNKKGLTFIYVGLPDTKGHAYSWGSKEYIQSITEVDKQIGILIQSLKKLDLYEDTYFLVVTDHGGIGYGHGGLSMDEIEVPWIISGPGIIKNKLIDVPNDVPNTSVTIAYILGLKPPVEWTGRAQKSVFSNTKESGINKRAYVNMPYSNATGGIYQTTQKVVLKNNDGSPIYYRLDGAEPDERSFRYSKPVLINKTVNLKAVSIKNGEKSNVLNIKMDICYPVKSAKLLYEPSEQYYGKGVNSLFDTQTAFINFKDKAWLGFHENDLVVEADLGESKNVHSIQINCLKNNYSYIFMPQAIEIYVSQNGKDFKKVAFLSKQQIDKNSHDGINRLVLKFKSVSTRFVKISAENIGKCPSGHYAAGSPAWLFVDEILIN